MSENGTIVARAPEAGPKCWCCDGRRSDREQLRCQTCYLGGCGHRDYPLAGKTTLHKGISLECDNITEYRVPTTNLDEAEVVSSIVPTDQPSLDYGTFHYPIFDVEMPVELDGNRMVIRKRVSWDEHRAIAWRLMYGGISTTAQVYDAMREKTNAHEDLHDAHWPTFFFDVPVHVVPSTTAGHFHVYIDRKITWEGYLALLEAFAKAGIVQEGYVAASKSRGYTSVRLPWVKKANGTTDPF